ncbi:lysis system o-spanin lipoprotein Rz1 [Photorhabdus sp. RM71S]
MLPLVVSGCASRQPVQRAKPLPPQAWAMQPPHELTQQLNKIIRSPKNDC